MDKSQVFIASSTEQEQVARRIEQTLGESETWTVRVWRDMFAPSDHNIESLEKALDWADFAVVVMTGDDKVRQRKNTVLLPRDNVLFELGLFIGRLGRHRSFFFVDGRSGTKLLTDLLGVEPAKFYPEGITRSPGNLSLDAQCDFVKERIRAEGPRPKPSPGVRSDQAKLWRFISSIAGKWWQTIETRKGPSQSEAAPVVELSYVTLSCDPATNSPTFEGETYNQQGKKTGSWKSVSCGVVLAERRVYYHWKGHHDYSDVMNYGGQGSVVFDDQALVGDDGRFWKTDLLRAVDSASTHAFRLTRCSAEEEATMQRRDNLSQRLIEERLKPLPAG